MVNFQLDRQSPMPLYYQIKEWIRSMIHAGELNPGDRIPPEDILSQQLQVSRMTMRRALCDLANDGLLIRKRGIGTLVASPPQELPFFVNKLAGLTEEMASKGLAVQSQVLVHERQLATYEISRQLQLQLHEHVILIRRLRSTNHIPLVIENTYHPLKRFPALLNTDFTDRSIYNFLQEQYQVRPHQAQDSFIASVADIEEAELLDIENWAPVMRYQRIALDSEDKPIEFTRSIYRADRFKFVVHFHQRHSPEDQDGSGSS
jgi:GntR family transcriptional regulator